MEKGGIKSNFFAKLLVHSTLFFKFVFMLIMLLDNG